MLKNLSFCGEQLKNARGALIVGGNHYYRIPNALLFQASRKSFFLRLATIGALFISNEKKRTYIYKIYKLLPPLGCQPGSLGTVSKCLIHPLCYHAPQKLALR